MPIVFALPIRPVPPKMAFYVEKVNGVVVLQQPGASVWVPVAGESQLPDGALIRVEPDAILRLRITHMQDGKKSDRRLDVEEPSILRLDSNLLRTKSQLDVAIDLTSMNNPESDLSLYSSIGEAWKAIRSIALKGDKLPSPTLEASKSTAANVTRSPSKDLTILTPTDRQILKTDKWPLQFEVHWKMGGVKPGENWKVEIRRGGMEAISHIVPGERSAHRIIIDQEGEYEIVISSDDNKTISKPVRITALGPLRAPFFYGSKQLGKEQMLTVDLLKPDKNFMFLTTSGKPLSFEFCWKTPEVEFPGQISALLTVRDKAGKLITNIKSASDCAVAKFLPTGEMLWEVTLHHQTDNNVETTAQVIGRSHRRKLTLTSSRGPKGQFGPQLDSLFKGKRSATLVIE